ncbi:SDR family NAD(P)-dependent oxidoreductase, partial [candidate division WOR-3 bacterium]|nr:SDR family NAD(P)-dependent oxidoreductase [candidate division WOR-3 bacterium]MBD3364861.1 SDR family NAD(P)-dependent oxidoreductase [candidate division WOR-3 bacterium]
MKIDRKFYKYVRQYELSNIYAMIKNNSREPAVCPDGFSGRLVVVTGATSGIGYAAAREYASHGANLLCVNRNSEKSKALKREIEKEFKVRCDFVTADLSVLADIHRAAAVLAGLKTPIDVVIHNAGVYLTARQLTPDGLERVFALNYLSSFIINYTLLGKLSAQKRSRIILVNSEGHRFAAWGLRLDDLNWERRRYSGWGSYGSAKTAQLLSMMVFAERLEHTGVSINAMHPGAVKTESGQENGPVYLWFKRNFIDKSLKPPQVSARALYYLGVSKKVEGQSGRFFNLTTLEEPAPPAVDRDTAYKLWDMSVEMGG